MIIDLLLLSIAGALLVMAAVATLNALTIPRLGQRYSPVDLPKVSILVPARDESSRIQACVGALLAQNYPNFELLVLDDSSSDNTFDLALAAGGSDPRLRLLAGQPLPAGWLGKNWACHQLAGHSRGDLLVFTDADVTWSPGALTAIVGSMQTLQAAMFSVWPTQRSISWGERLVVPMMMLAILGYLPEMLVRLSTWSPFAAANGQCLAFWRKTYRVIGGHVAVRDQIVEDVALARLVRKRGLRQAIALGEGMVSCRMYRGWAEVRRGFAKNILAGHTGRPVFLLASALFHWGVFLAPFVWLAAGWALPLPGWPLIPFLLALLAVIIRALTAATSRQRISDALLLPVSVVLMTIIAAQALVWHFGDGGQWKGRSLTPRLRREEAL